VPCPRSPENTTTPHDNDRRRTQASACSEDRRSRRPTTSTGPTSTIRLTRRPNPRLTAHRPSPDTPTVAVYAGITPETVDRGLSWARGDIMDVPDRLPYELADRVWESQPRLRREHEVQPVQLVMATKVGTQTIRPFVRPHVGDMLLFQALIDRLRGPIEAALPERDTLFSYRLSRTTADDPVAGSPQWRDFHEASALGVADSPDSYVVRGDLSSFFLTVDLSRLRGDLLDLGGDGEAIRDLFDLLHAWRQQGVRGPPQGLPPSGPLANVYLLPMDRVLEDGAVAYWRFSDDFLAPSFDR